MYKVKINKLGKNGDQRNYSLLRKQAYHPDGKEEYEVKNTMSAIPREQSNVEVEDGEVAIGDINQDGNLEHFRFIGKKHSEGGIPANIADGSFIFSNTKDLTITDPSILKEVFGMSSTKKGYTPAQIAKKYQLNDFMNNIKSEDSDPIKKRSSDLMIKNNMEKLAMLAMIQESMKGFPDGPPSFAESILPEIAQEQEMKFGGFYQEGGVGPTGPMGVSNIPTGVRVDPKNKTIIGSTIDIDGKTYTIKKESGNNYLLSNSEGKSLFIPKQTIDKIATTGMSSGNISAWRSDKKHTFSNPSFKLEKPTQQPSKKTTEQVIEEAYRESGPTGPTGAASPAKSKNTNTTTTKATVKPGAVRVSSKTKEEYFKNLPAEVKTYLDNNPNAVYWDNNRIRVQLPEDAPYDIKNALASHNTAYGYNNIVQTANAPQANKAQRYINKDSKFNHFYGGLRPQDFERKLAIESDGVEAVNNMDELSIRKRAFEILGIDHSTISPEKLQDPVSLYADDDFFNKTFYPAFTKVLPEAKFREDLGDDTFLGYEHLDAIGFPEVPKTEQPGSPETPGANPPKDDIKAPPPFTPEKQPIKNGPWYLPDINNFVGRLTDKINKYEPLLGTYDAMSPGYALKDPTRLLAANQEQQQSYRNMLENTTDGNVAAATMLGSSGEAFGNAANAISGIETENVGIVNNAFAQKASLENAERVANTQALQKYVGEMAMLNENYDKAVNEKKWNSIEAFNRGWDNHAKKLAFEQVLTPQWYQDPITGEWGWSGIGKDPTVPDLSGSASTNMTYDQYGEELKKRMDYLVNNLGISKDEAFKEASKTLKGLNNTEDAKEMIKNRMDGYMYGGSLKKFIR